MEKIKVCWWNQQMHPLPHPPNWPVNSLFRAAASSQERKGTSHVEGRLWLLFKSRINTQCVHTFMELKETFSTLSEFPFTVGTVWHLKLHEGKVSFLMYIHSWSLIYFTCPSRGEPRKRTERPKTPQNLKGDWMNPLSATFKADQSYFSNTSEASAILPAFVRASGLVWTQPTSKP